jgi:CRP-like cAMP-binding protein
VDNPLIFPIGKFNFESDSLFQGLPEADLAELEHNMTFQKYRKGQVIFVESTFPAGIFYLKKGRIKKFKTDREGREHILYICNEDELFGYSAILCEEAYPDSASVLGDSIVGFISKDIFLKVISQSPILSNRLLKNLSHEFGVLVNRNTSFVHKSVKERLALTLLILKEKFRGKGNADESIAVEISLSRKDLSGMTGAAVETLVRLLQQFKAEGLIEVHGRKIIILDSAQLEKIANYS